MTEILLIRRKTLSNQSIKPKDALCIVWLKLAQWFWRRRFLKIVNVFSLFRNYFPLEKRRAIHLKNLNSLHLRMIYAKFGWNWPSGSREEDFLNLSMYFCNFVILSPWKKAELFIWINLSPLNPRMICGKFNLVEIGPVL